MINATEKLTKEQRREAREKERSTSFYIRVDQVVVLILSNERFLKSNRATELTEMVTEKFGCEQRTALKYIYEAKKEVRAIGRKHAEKAFTKAIRGREFIIASCISGPKKDYRTALAAMKDRDELSGLYVQRVEHSGDITEKIVFVNDIKE